jgi:hypothetical protein
VLVSAKEQPVSQSLREWVEARYQQSANDLVGTAEFAGLEAGTASRGNYDLFIGNVVRSHLTSPKILAFLFAVAPPASSQDLLHNMLEELGIEEEDGTSHPDLLKHVLTGAGLADWLPRLEALATEDLRKVVVEPLLYGSLREVGFAVLVETVAYEWMLSRTASRISTFLAKHRGLDAQALAWFSHHSEVDIAHAEQGLESLEKYATYYHMDRNEAETIVEMTLRDNVFVKRYFGELTVTRSAVLAEE